MPNNPLSVVILAAGQGKRMGSRLPKVLHPLAGIPMLERVVNAAQALNPENILIVYGNGGNTVPEALSHKEGLTFVIQKERLGTGHAVLQALPYIPDHHQVLILYGDVPLITEATLNELLTRTKKDALSLIVTEVDQPFGFGRIIRDETHNITAIVEEKDANTEQKQIREINTGMMATQAHYLKSWLPELKNHNSQQEYYLTDIVAQAKAHSIEIDSIHAFSQEVRGVNTLNELVSLERFFQRQQAESLLSQGVTIKDPSRLDIRGNLTASPNTVIDINVIIEGEVTLGEGSSVGAGSILRDAHIGKQVTIEPYSVIEHASIADNATVGPFARIRPGTQIGENAKVGNFVEVKNSAIGPNSKASHLSYLGDASVGKDVNIGAGTITCNYDGFNKHRTTIEDKASIGANTNLVAPVTVHKNATIGAGSTITDDAPADKLTLSRSRQTTIEHWKKPCTDKV